MANITRIKTGGRIKGTPNKSSAEVRALALNHSEAAIESLVNLMNNSTNDNVRLQAAREILDRGVGKAIGHDKIIRYEQPASIFDVNLSAHFV